MSDQDKAMDLIRDELAKDGSGNPGLTVLGEYLTERLRQDPGIAAAVLKFEKPVKAGFEAIRNHARKIAKGGWACVDDKTGFGIACKQWGIDPSAAVGGTSPHRGGKDAQAPAHDGEGTERRADNIRPYTETGNPTPARAAVDPLDLDALLGV